MNIPAVTAGRAQPSESAAGVQGYLLTHRMNQGPACKHH